MTATCNPGSLKNPAEAPEASVGLETLPAATSSHGAVSAATPAPAEAALTSLDTMRAAAGMLHDIRNLLNVVLGCARAERRRESASPAESLVDTMEMAARDAGLLAGAAMALLRTGRRATANLQTLDAGAHLMQLRPLLVRLLPPECDLRVERDPSRCLILADMAEFDAALLNLVANARDAMEAGAAGQSRISMRIRAVRHAVADHRRTQEWVRITIADNGRGMDAKTLARIGSPYFTSKGRGDAGLGVFQVRRFVVAHGGDLRIRSVRGRGTAVQLLFPRACGRAEMRPPSPERGIAGRHMQAGRGGAAAHSQAQPLGTHRRQGVRACPPPTLAASRRARLAIRSPAACDTRTASCKPEQGAESGPVHPGTSATIDGRCLSP